MRLFVWCDPYPVKYGSSMVFAIADTVELARKEASCGYTYSFGDIGGDRKDWSYIILGEPTRVLDVPVAEWHEWSE